MDGTGTYQFVFSGATGVGMGVFTLNNFKLVDTDLGGVSYKGHVVQADDGELTVSLEMTVPAGVLLVQGVSAQNMPYDRLAKFTAPRDFGDGRPFSAPIPPGDVTLMIKRIPDEWAWIAKGVHITIKPIS